MSDISNISNLYDHDELAFLEGMDWKEFAEGSWKEDVFGAQSRLDDTFFLKHV